MKKLFLLIALATSISSQSFAVFEKDAEGDYVLLKEDGAATDLFSHIVGKSTQIKDVAEDGRQYIISVQIEPYHQYLLSNAFDEGKISFVFKSDKIELPHLGAAQVYTAAIEGQEEVVEFSLSERQIHQ